MKDIGSIFPLSNKQIAEAENEFFSASKDQKVYYALCREALYDIAISLEQTNKIVLLPSYTCQTVIAPFEEAGWECHFYSIDKDLYINIDSLLNEVNAISPALLLVHPYYGMDLSEKEIEAIKLVGSKNIKIVLDITQCIFTSQKLPFVDYCVGSYRKWFPVPDGAFLTSRYDISCFNREKAEHDAFVEKQTDAMYLRNLYFESGEQRIKDISIRLSKSADHIAECSITPHCMSRVSSVLLSKEDKENNIKRRIENFTYLFKNLVGNEKYEPVCNDIKRLTSAPLYFTIYVKNRRNLQVLLAANKVYAPVIWPVEDSKVLIDENVKYIYDHLLAIPCDQRYSLEDMERVINVILSY